MGVYNFDRAIKREGTASLKWDKYKGEDVIPLWVADMDFQSPPGVIEALNKRIQHGVFGYSIPPKPLIQSVIRRLDTLYGWTIKNEWLVWLPGLVTGLNIACRTVGDKGDHVLTAVPVYPPFLTAPQFSQKICITTPLVFNDNKWVFDFDRLEKAITKQTRLFMLCNPHNPVGRMFTKTELKKLASICHRHDLVICSDEIHCDLILDASKVHTPFATLDPDIEKRTITLMAPSKTFNIPGLGCSLAIIPDNRLRRKFKETMAGIVPEVNILGFTAALAAYQDRSGWLSKLLQYLRKNRNLTSSTIKKIPGLSMTHVEATYLGWINITALDLEKPVRFFERAGVGLSDGNDFGSPGYLRLNFGCTQELLLIALERIQRAVSGQ
jgi:cystathionine beta-lyase